MYTIERTVEQEHWFPFLEELFSNGGTTFIGPGGVNMPHMTAQTRVIRVSAPLGRPQAVAIPTEALRHMPEGLVELALNHYRIESLPDDFGVLYPSLKYLSIRNTGLTHVPRSMGGMKNLVSLILVENRLSDLPPTLMHIPTLRHLSITDNPTLLTIPRVVFYLRQLSGLIIVRCGITQISPEIANLAPTLQVLSLGGNRLSGDVVPWDMLSTLSKLASLSLSWNPLRHIPERFVGGFQQLESLFLADAQLMKFPRGVLQMTQLEGLYIQGNYIREIPKEIEQLAGLKTIDARRNPTLRWVPNELGSDNMPQFSALLLTREEYRNLNPRVAKRLLDRQIIQLHVD